MKTYSTILIAASIIAWCTSVTAVSAGNQAPVKVTVDNYVRAETDVTMARYVKQGAFGKFLHFRHITDIDNQVVIRMNFDTLYSFVVLDLTTPATIYMPDPGKRFQSLMCISEDHSIPSTMYGPGYFKISEKMMRTRYAFCAVRTFANPKNAKDMNAAHALQDEIVITQDNSGQFQVPDWDTKSLETMRQLLAEVAKTKTDTSDMFGDKDRLNPIDWLLGAAYGWGGNPKEAAIAINAVPEKNDGKTAYVLNVPKDVPVDGFWSVTLYNAKGYAPKNDKGVYSHTNVTAESNGDGSYTITFGGHGPNNFELVPDWNYIVRLYRPRAEVIDGHWRFPPADLGFGPKR